jgi:hypothetical protein
MSQWGVWCRHDSTETHIVPCDDKEIVGGHACIPTCWCNPRRDDEFPHLFVHHDPERGGMNS